MRALDLDLRRESRSGRWAGMVLLAGGVACAAVIGLEYVQVADEADRVRSSVRESGMAKRTRALEAPGGAEAQKVALEIKQASDVVFELARPWGELFATAELARTPDVALLSIESDNEKQRVRISGEARTLESVLEYLRSLSARPALAEVYLQSHELQKQDPQRPVRFVLGAEWALRK
jgi:Tfp pilus assembly protein PilN